MLDGKPARLYSDFRMNIELEISKVVNLMVGDRVVVTRADDTSDVMHHGTIKYFKKDGWVGIRVDREIVVHEWPATRVFAEVK